VLVRRGTGTLATVLGTCVAVCLYDEAARVAGMNHFVLARAPEGAAAPLRFGGPAMDALLARVCAEGAQPSRLVAKVFGGMVSGWSGTAASIGEQNAEVARAWLSAHGIPVVATDVGGPGARKLYLHAHDGLAWVRTL
jgi:chemotaxis protein CheD